MRQHAAFGNGGVLPALLARHAAAMEALGVNKRPQRQQWTLKESNAIGDHNRRIPVLEFRTFRGVRVLFIGSFVGTERT